MQSRNRRADAERRRAHYTRGMASAPLIAHVKNGRLVLDVPTDLPEGATVELHVDEEPAIVLMPGAEDDGLDDEQRAALHRSLVESVADFKAGRVFTSEEVMAELDARTSK